MSNRVLRFLACAIAIALSMLPFVHCAPGDDSANLCLNIRCSGHGTCYIQGGVPLCQCESGYRTNGVNCEKASASCEGQTCSGFGQCQVRNNIATCVCNTGYYAEGLSCVPGSGSCVNRTCNGHGTCQSGQCSCQPGFDPAQDCGQCVAGAGTYPNCQGQCVCTAGQFKCASGTAINVCDNGCTWTAKNCTDLCAPHNQNSNGCTYGGYKKVDQCWCAASGKSWLIWKVTDKCNDGYTPQAAVFSGASAWGPDDLQYDTPNFFEIECTTGVQMCLGAWQSDGTYWGCGEDCQQPKTLCVTCGSTLAQEHDLECS